MYVAAYPLFANNHTVLVRCSKDKALHGPESVIVEWMGERPRACISREDDHTISHPQSEPHKRVVILDTIPATGDTVVKLCNELVMPHSSMQQAGLLSERGNENQRFITVLSCYASPHAVAAVAAHSAIESIFVAHLAETVDEAGYLVASTNGDVGDKLFGRKA